MAGSSGTKSGNKEKLNNRRMLEVFIFSLDATLVTLETRKLLTSTLVYTLAANARFHVKRPMLASRLFLFLVLSAEIGQGNR